VGARNFLEATAGKKVRIVFVSSMGVLGTNQLKRRAMINESSPIELHPEWRDAYSYSKFRQEQLFREYVAQFGTELVILRPGVIYGPDGPQLSGRVGLNVFGWFVHVGGRNVLPLTYVENCANAIVTAGLHPDAAGKVFHVNDDDLPTCQRYFRQYRKEVKRVRAVRIPYFMMLLLSRLLERYRKSSKGQLPPILTPYKVKALWRGNRFSNTQLKSIGWRQNYPTAESLRFTFQQFHARLSEGQR
jgi:nucleoside-diphosphate-sugar epimerase